MKFQKGTAKLFAALVAGTVVLSSLSFSSAATVKTTPQTTTKASAAATIGQEQKNKVPPPGKGKQNFGKPLITSLASAVTDGILTQTESDSIKTFLSTYKPAEKTDIFAALVTGKVLSQEKADALKTYIETQRVQKEEKSLTDTLNQFVTDKTITQAQADTIKAAVLKAEQERKAEMEKVKAMTEAERNAYFESKKDTFVNPLAALVTDGTITQAVADKITSELHIGFGPGGHPGKGPQGHKGGPCRTAK
ncbi:MAG: hypothetical protein BGN88_12110 [Clostridiales bacterium 43-6]|nr:MAG: hypothetical protein BGN88_12110 [Clostridiales bacterium 43-6]